VFLFKEPSRDDIRHSLDSQKSLSFSYTEVGASREGVAPPGYVADGYRVRLGEGQEAYARAVEALREWRQFDLGWVRLLPSGVALEEGVTVGVLAWHYGFWSLNPARIVYLVEETGDVERFGFGYGTLPGHAERGEERFSIEWNREDESIYYDVFAFSMPRHLLTWLGFPFVRMLQRRFARDSKKAMVEAVRP
jgi:uncharacterized protein (UPF0548 family)